MESIVYSRLETGDLKKPLNLRTTSNTDWNAYPGNRCNICPAATPQGPPSDHILMKTGGNALQAIPRKLFENNSHHTMVAVTVREGMHPGDYLLVACPAGTGRAVQAIVPIGVLPGHKFLVKLPALQEKATISAHSTSTQVVMGEDVSHTDLYLHEGNTNISTNFERQHQTASLHSKPPRAVAPV